MPEIRLSHDYPQPPAVVWRALTEPDLVARWTATGRGGRPEGFQPYVGCQFRYVGRPVPGWDGIVRCEVLEVNPPELLRYSWQAAESEHPTDVLWRIEAHGGGTRLTYLHTGFTAITGQIMSRLLRHVRRGMLDRGLPAVLRELEPSPGVVG